MVKWILATLLVALMSSQVIAQKEVIYGTVRTDGYQKITRGALWSKRPEAKMIQEGSYPLGFRVYTLSENYFVRFVDDEHNNFDRNYIVFPAGEKIYTNESGQYFAAICGNRIDYLRPVDLVKIVEEKVEEPTQGKVKTEIKISAFNFPEDLGGIVVKQVPNLGNLNPNPPKEREKIKIGKIVLRVGEGGLLGAVAFFIIKALLGNHHHHDSGVPGGAPVTRPVVVPPPVVPPVNPGGPGGAPTTP